MGDDFVVLRKIDGFVVIGFLRGMILIQIWFPQLLEVNYCCLFFFHHLHKEEEENEYDKVIHCILKDAHL
ncbi:hypothetical protein AU387_06685 [Bacillus halotolerans]|nr:hypothetical protein AU387_06685 [Bacillus halotolerans]